MPNQFATIALLAWPLVALWLFSTKSTAKAIIWTILGAHLLLPVGAEIKFAGVPPFDKNSIPSLVAVVGILFTRGLPRMRTGFGVAEILLLGMLVVPFITSELNTDRVLIGGHVLPGVGHYDALSATVGQLIFVLPFFFGRYFLRGPAETEDVLRALVAAALFYSIPMLFEIRVSPQLHAWVYGFHPFEFLQQIRDGGFRPAVFLGHGLVAAFFVATSAVASCALWRAKTRVMGLPGGLVTGYLAALLYLCKTLGALVYGAFLLPVARFLKPTMQVRIAAALVLLALLYPSLRASDLFPTTQLYNMALSVSEDRAGSLKFRFDQEQQLLDHARERFLFGWGRFGRNRLYDESSGDDLSTTDGRWIITMGIFGFVGFLAEFGLLAWPVLRATSAIRAVSSNKDAILLAAMALIVAINLVDLLPNSPLSPWTWLLAGALLGRSEALVGEVRARREARPVPRPYLVLPVRARST